MARQTGRQPRGNKAGEPGDVKTTTVDDKPLRPAQCRAYMRQTLATEFRTIVDGLVKGARSGSCQHVKLATELLEPKPRAKRKQTGRRTVTRWLDEMERGL
jgi:hypothetical protein